MLLLLAGIVLFLCFGLLMAFNPKSIWIFNKKTADSLKIDNRYFYNEGSNLFGVNKDQASQIRFIKIFGWILVTFSIFSLVLILILQRP